MNLLHPFITDPRYSIEIEWPVKLSDPLLTEVSFWLHKREQEYWFHLRMGDRSRTIILNLGINDNPMLPEFETLYGYDRFTRDYTSTYIKFHKLRKRKKPLIIEAPETYALIGQAYQEFVATVSPYVQHSDMYGSGYEGYELDEG